MAIELKLGWLAPNGDLFECKYYAHLSTAEFICDNYGWEHTHIFNDCDDTLLKHGFAKIGISLLGNREYYVHWERKLTSYQRYFLNDYFIPDEELKFPMNITSRARFEFEDEFFDEQ